MSTKQLIFLMIFLFVLFGYVVPYLQYKNFNPPKPSADVKRSMPKESKKKKELNIIYMEENNNK